MGAGFCGPCHVGPCAIGKWRSPLRGGEEEAGLGPPLPIPGQPGLRVPVLAEVGVGWWAAVMGGDGGGEVLQGVVGGQQDHREDHQGDLDLLEAADAPQLQQEVIEGHGARPGRVGWGLRTSGPRPSVSVALRLLPYTGGDGAPWLLQPSRSWH